MSFQKLNFTGNLLLFLCVRMHDPKSSFLIIREGEEMVGGGVDMLAAATTRVEPTHLLGQSC